MKEPDLFSIDNNKIKSINSNLKQIPTKFKPNLISLKSIPQIIPGSKSFRQQSHYFTMKNSKEKNKRVNIKENISLEQNSQGKKNQKIKNKDMIINIKNPINYANSKGNSNFLNYKKNPSINTINKTNLIKAKKMEDESQNLRINTFINSINPYFSQSANNSIYIKSNKNKKNNNNLISCLTGWIRIKKGIILKRYNTTNNTANNSINESMEINNIVEDNKKNINNSKKNLGKSIKLKNLNKKNNNTELNLYKKETKAKGKISQTTKNSRQNSGEKHPGSNKSKLMKFKYNKLFLNKIPEKKKKNHYHRSNNKLIAKQIII